MKRHEKHSKYIVKERLSKFIAMKGLRDGI